MKLAKISWGVALLLPTLNLQGETEPSNITVAAVLRSASAFVGGTNSIILKPGVTLQEGAIITTGPDSAVDLFMGNQAGTLRLTENATLAVTRFALTPENEIEEIQLHLSAGTLLGLGNQLPVEKRYQIKLNNGVVDVQAKQYRLGADGFVIALNGKLLFAEISSEEAEPTLHNLEAPPALYYWPRLGVRPAPPALISEIIGQSSVRLPSP